MEIETRTFYTHTYTHEKRRETHVQLLDYAEETRKTKSIRIRKENCVHAQRQ